MKFTIYSVLLVLFCISCKGKNENPFGIDENRNKETRIADFVDNKIWNQWTSYYKQKDSNFSINKFKFLKKDTLIVSKGTIFGVFDKEFDSIYLPFLRFNPAEKKYIDLDSYQWTLDGNNEIVMDVDQEVALVNLEDKTIHRIAFRGALQWVEDAFWENDNCVVLLENSNENRLRFSEINFITKTINVYEHDATLEKKPDYFMHKLYLENLNVKQSK
ncbi:conserved hypothetical protein [Flavobacterium sp. 9AF]|uniref:hypothetical protein n=1 Tax=Flavobacterium sp. 9AF TaxID=2653142 RepID=UPI0012F470CD|nr:hypothetical protein [Flavobacterium sp. 9AF]VXC24583.1 conserved hypothetical protein [Flavobacterium sp. 9AF]